MAFTVRTATCSCGRVRCEGIGAPIVSTVCYCSDCQAGGTRSKLCLTQEASSIQTAERHTSLIATTASAASKALNCSSATSSSRMHRRSASWPPAAIRACF
ncbi:GFA family protein [Sphingomonas sp. PB4P5]|uniref:GFA family protein n=1 Tax=Parasphingomonas puruogangriensis TaxID=3096155 RepID=UPI003FA77625